MIRYRLKCDQGHEFESWFASTAAFDGLHKAGHLACATCGSARVEKALMAPSVATVEAETRPLAAPASALEEKLAALRRHVEETSDYVGTDFATEARAIHLGEAPERPIWGEARPDEARALVEEGVPVAPLPFMGKARAN
ncbi:MAG: DUF1178 family protein [Rhodobacter sp.]|uniref:DUF1178 family protein n=1 Tax=Pararhodobacter sp. TaxID=2127056 RepID=UPI001DC74B6D|nr:DUF1178 family protein [Pararhodobacter sp.]MCB1344678.1 DUF1178 family protein [Paracoccaceae bacterium]MCC0071704.1 DUF1178 family protein [Rhodobacter sp.]HPD92985.1 DUF1178 family protein [Pararhodobacter sp.]